MDENRYIPKIIHYCWFGSQEKPKMVQQCMDSWKKQLPTYQFKEWNEENFNINVNQYVSQAYAAKKFAFVSDYVRVYALYHEGGIYLDTDVEVFQSFDPLLKHHSFWGFEQEHFIATSTIGSVKGNQWFKAFLDMYDRMPFLLNDGSYNELTNVALITKKLEEEGLVRDGQFQELKDIGVFYPQEYFSPYDYINCRNLSSEKTYTLHHFHKSWLPLTARLKGNIKKTAAKWIGGENIKRIREMVLRN
ncbi:glycosyl transferase [Bacillus sp. TS-2]|nr:glycosyl transferase [Bacillus sp. TS-2]